jgi:hypothetical protein
MAPVQYAMDQVFEVHMIPMAKLEISLDHSNIGVEECTYMAFGSCNSGDITPHMWNSEGYTWNSPLYNAFGPYTSVFFI